MANTIEYAKIFSKALDKVKLPGLTSQKMETEKYEYKGGNEIKLPKMSVTGMSDYSRETGYKSGSITFEYETHQMTMDRGVEFTLDVMDEDESGFVATAGAVTNELNKVEVVPELDAYRYSKIFSILNANVKAAPYVPAEATIFEQLLQDISDLEDIIGEEASKTIYMSYSAARVLALADKVEKRLDVNINTGAIKSKIMSIDGIQIIRVPSARFKTSYTFGDDGFTVDALAMGLNWIIADDDALVAINKHDKMKIFSPDQNQKTDGYLIQYRRYHDLFIPDNKIAGVSCSYTPIAAPALTATVAVGSASGTTKFTATADSGNTLGYVLGAASLGSTLYNLYKGDIDGLVEPYTSGADITATAGQYLTMLEFDSVGHVVKSKEVVLASGDIKA